VHLVYTCCIVKALGHSSDINDHTDDQHTVLGRTLLPQTLNSLLKTTFHGEKTPPADKRGAIFEILRVGANLCMDHGTFSPPRGHRSRDLRSLNRRFQSDENRGNLLEAGFPQTVVTLLESYSESIPPKRGLTDPLPIHPEDLKIVKTAVGVILNVSLGYGISSTLVAENGLTALFFSYRAGQNSSTLFGGSDHHPSHLDCDIPDRFMAEFPSISFGCRTGV